MDRIKVLRQRKADLVTEADALSAKDAEGTITEEEKVRYTAILDADLPAVNASIAREERLMDERRTMAPVSNPSADTTEEATDRLPATAKSDDDKPKFKSFAEAHAYYEKHPEEAERMAQR